MDKTSVMIEKIPRSSHRRTIVFVVSNNVQVENALSVVRHLSVDRYVFFNLLTAELTRNAPTFKSRNVPFSARLIARLIFPARLPKNGIVLLAQDLGLLWRIISRTARRLGNTIVLMPDGILSTEAVVSRSSRKFSLAWALNKLLSSFRLAYPGGVRMGASNPDLLLRWGKEWAPCFALSSTSTVLDAGCPRTDSLSGIAPVPRASHLLICSQPLHIPAWSRAHVLEWYEFLETALPTLSGIADVKLRLHPAEPKSQIPATVLKYAEPLQTSLQSDIEWASVVASPFSTALLEAAVAGRSVIVLARDRLMRDVITTFPFFQHPDMKWSDWSVDGLLGALRHARPLEDLSGYLAVRGRSGQVVADILASQALGTHDAE